jgi:antitoxin component YwqK of YwqJK toxin-antitoxin module
MEYWPNGNKMNECCYTHDIPTGLCTAYYKNGRRELQGRCIETTGASPDGTTEGAWCYYADDGETIWRKSTCSQGRRI